MLALRPCAAGAAIAFVVSLSAATAALAQGQRMEIATLPTGSVANSAGTAIAALLSQKLNWTVLATPYAGQQVLIPMVNRGEAAMTLINVGDSDQAYRGVQPFYKEAHKNLRLISVGYENRSIVLTTVKAGIKSMAELKGKRVTGVFSAHQTCKDLADAAFANAGLKWDDVRVVPVTSAVTGVQAVGEGRAQVTSCAAVGMGAVREVNARDPVRFVSIDPDPAAMKRARDIFPGLRPVTMKAGSAEGVVDDTVIFGYDFYLVGHKGLADDVVEAIVKTIHDNVPDLVQANRLFATWKPERMGDPDVTLPYHPGAIKYFKAKNAWTAENDKRQQALSN